MEENNNNISNGEFISIPLEKIVIDSNIRSENNEEDIDGLAISLKEQDLLQPISVYKRDNEYVIIFGHRRFLAAKKAGFKEIQCILKQKPNKLNLIYTQFTENEQSLKLSPEDIERCIKELRDLGQSFEQIAKRIGKSVSWVRTCAVAYNVRVKNKDMLIKANLSLGTKEAYLLRNASEEEIKEAISQIVVNPDEKNDVFKEVNLHTKKKMNVGGRTRKSKNEKDEKNNDISLSLNIKNILNITLDDEKKILLIKKGIINNFVKAQIEEFIELLINNYIKIGYTYSLTI